jgi:hypothetical protein
MKVGANAIQFLNVSPEADMAELLAALSKIVLDLGQPGVNPRSRGTSSYCPDLISRVKRVRPDDFQMSLPPTRIRA